MFSNVHWPPVVLHMTFKPPTRAQGLPLSGLIHPTFTSLLWFLLPVLLFSRSVQLQFPLLELFPLPLHRTLFYFLDLSSRAPPPEKPFLKTLSKVVFPDHSQSSVNLITNTPVFIYWFLEFLPCFLPLSKEVVISK